MRVDDKTAIRTLGVVAVTAAMTLLFRLNQRVQARRILREDAVRTLRESGEFYFAPVTE